MYRQSFFFHDDPRGMTRNEASPCYAQMNIREFHPGFRPSQRGCFSSELIDVSSYNELGLSLPSSQTGYGDLNERPRERNTLYCEMTGNTWPKTKLPMVIRRTIRLYDLDINPTLKRLESSMEKGYSQSAVKEILRMWPMFGGSIETASHKDALLMTLLPLCIEKARLQFYLDSASRRVRVRYLGGQRFRADFVTQKTDDDELFLSHVTGETCKFQDGELKMLLYVNRLTNTGLELTSMDRHGFRADNQAPPTIPPLAHYDGVVMKAEFIISSFRFKVLETGCIDAWTAIARKWFEGDHLTFTGVPMIDRRQLEHLKTGSGFFTQSLSAEQKDAVVMLLEHKAEHTVQSVIAAPGTGKTMLLLEFMSQLYEYHQEDTNSSALTLYCTNTNVNAKITAEKLAALGFPIAHMVLVVGERVAMNEGIFNSPVRVVRITDFVLTDEIQTIFGTVGTVCKIPMNRSSDVTVFQKSVRTLIIDEATAYSLAAVNTAMSTNGEPQQVVLAGDPRQIPHMLLSRTAEKLHGHDTALDALKRHDPTYFDPNKGYPTPLPPFGCTLTEVHRAMTFLVLLISTLFYDGQLIPSETCKLHDVRTEKILAQFQDSDLLKPITKPCCWVDFEGEAVRDPVTKSLSNPQEAKLVVNYALQMADKVGDKNLLILSPYKSQVHLLQTLLPQDRKVRVASVDETQGLEAEVVIISLVRSQRGAVFGTKTAGFLDDYRRANVMISRGKNLVLLVGSLDHFWESGCDHWQLLLNNWAHCI